MGLSSACSTIVSKRKKSKLDVPVGGSSGDFLCSLSQIAWVKSRTRCSPHGGRCKNSLAQ